MTQSTAFQPFDNDCQVVTVSLGDDEWSCENAFDYVVCHGTLTVKRHDPSSRHALDAVIAQLMLVRQALG